MFFNEKILIDFLNKLQIDFAWLIFKLFLGAVLLLIIKSWIERIATYLMLRSNKYIAIGVSLRINDFAGVITKLTPSGVWISNEEETMYIPITRWKYNNVIFKK